MKTTRIDQQTGHNEEWTSIGVRACQGRSGEAQGRVECHIEHFLHRYDAKRGRAHLNFPTMTVEQAIELRDNLTAAIHAAALKL